MANAKGACGKRQPGAATRRLFVRLRRNEDGVAAIEFAILAIPFFMLLFAIIETCVAYAAEQVLDNAVDTMGRQLRTGQITFQDPAEPTYMSENDFFDAFCDEVEIMLDCDETKLYLNVQGYDDWSEIPVGIPLSGGGACPQLAHGDFGHDPLGSGEINMVRAYYRWQIITDLIRPYITNTCWGDESAPSEYLIVGTAAFRNEAY